MLLHLSIQNYALIRHLELDFDNGFTVITGETGAGKSILLGALDLILGKRADTRVLLDKSSKCYVEGAFDVSNYKLSSFFSEHDLDQESKTLLRREINAQGKSRAFINDTPVKLSVLEQLGKQLVDIHSQHQSLSLIDSDFQVSILDSYAGLLVQSREFRVMYSEFEQLANELATLKEQEEKSRAEKDYFEFLITELDNARILDGEQEAMEDELSVLDHAEEIRSVLYRSIQLMDNDGSGVIENLNEMQSGLSKIRDYNPELKEINDRLESMRIEMMDLRNEVERFEEQVAVNPARSREIQDRLDTLYGLQQKHRVSSNTELLRVLADIQNKLSGLENLESTIKKHAEALGILNAKIDETALYISNKRKEAIPAFAKEVERNLQQLGMPNGIFEVSHSLLKKPGKDGIDKIRFMFNANKGGHLDDVSKVASGGEKSRLMLAVKSLISKKVLLPTIIFDEIDTGVSGAVADRVGAILLSLSGNMQVISITHLPQIAGKGRHHYQVYKNVSENYTSTHVKKLNPDERILEIAKLLSGQEVTDASVESARQLLKN